MAKVLAIYRPSYEPPYVFYFIISDLVGSSRASLCPCQGHYLMVEANAIGAGRNDPCEGKSQHKLAVHIYRNKAARIEKRNGDKFTVLLHGLCVALWQEHNRAYDAVAQSYHELFLGDYKVAGIWVKE
jgi:hypothetical protein